MNTHHKSIFIITLLLSIALTAGIAHADNWDNSLFNTSDTLVRGGGIYAYVYDNDGGTFWQGAPGNNTWNLIRLNNQSAFNMNGVAIVFYDSHYLANIWCIYGSNDVEPNATSGNWTSFGCVNDTTGVSSINFTNPYAYAWYLNNMTQTEPPGYNHAAIVSYVLSGNKSIDTLPGAGPPPCTPSYSCNSYADCAPDNTSACLSVTDANSCGDTPPGDLSAYNQSCSYVAPPPVNGDSSAQVNALITEIIVCLAISVLAFILLGLMAMAHVDTETIKTTALVIFIFIGLGLGVAILAYAISLL